MNGRRAITVLAAIGVLFAVASGAFAARKYLITSSAQIKPGAVAFGNLSADAKRRLAGKPGPAGPAGPAGPDDQNGLPAVSGLIAWTSDPAHITANSIDSTGSMHGGEVSLTKGQVIKSLSELVITAGAGMTHGMFAIYDGNLNLVAQTADNPAAFQVTNQWATIALTAPYTVPASGRYYLVDLLAGATMPGIGNDASLAGSSARNVLPNGVPRNINVAGPNSAPPTKATNNGTGITRSIIAF